MVTHALPIVNEYPFCQYFAHFRITVCNHRDPTIIAVKVRLVIHSRTSQELATEPEQQQQESKNDVLFTLAAVFIRTS